MPGAGMEDRGEESARSPGGHAERQMRKRRSVREEGQPKERVTLADVAARAGISETTASHVLTGKRYVAAATKARVMLAVRELGYRPNLVARSLRVRSTQTIAFIVNDIGNVSLTTSIRGSASLLRQRGFAIDMVDSPEEGLSTAVVQQVLDRIPTGIIFFGEMPSRRVSEQIESAGVPFVVGGLGEPHPETCDVVYTDQEAAVRAVTALLAASVPRRRICFFGGDADDEGARARLAGFHSGMRLADRVVEEGDVLFVPYSIDGGMAAMERIDDVPAAIVAGSDQIAQGALIVARERGIRVPEQLRVVGFDNIESCRVTTPPLSSIDVGLVSQGLVCAELLLDRIEGRYVGPGRVIAHDTTFVERGSTGELRR